MNRKYTSRIAAVCHVSESEIAEYEKQTNQYIELPYPTTLPELEGSVFKQRLWELGIDVELPFEYQGVSQHRNRLNEIVTCGRWYGVERSDKEWLESGVASKEAIDRASNNPFLDELYRHRGLTIETQAAGDERDKYIVEDEDEQLQND